MPDYGSILGAAGDVGQLLAQMERQRALGRQTAATANQNQDRIALERAGLGTQQSQLANQFGLGKYGLDLATSNQKNQFGLGRIDAANTINNMDLSQRKFQLAAPGARASNAVRGDILANAQDATISAPSTIPVPQVSGGLRPSMFSGATRALGSEMSTQALAGQRAGDTFAALPGLPDYSGPTTPLPTYREPPPLPTQTPLPAAGKLDTGLGLGGALGALGGALGNAGGSSGGNILDAAKGLYNLFKGHGSDLTPLNGMVDPNTGYPYEVQGPQQDPFANLDPGDWGGTLSPRLNPDPDIDPNQLPGGVDPWQEYLRWLADQQQGGDLGGSQQGDSWDAWGGE